MQNQRYATSGAALSRPIHFLVVNFPGAAIGGEKCGRLSPPAAYNAATNRFLILDVARYKYPNPLASVTASDLFNAMNTTDTHNVDQTRGFALVCKKLES